MNRRDEVVKLLWANNGMKVVERTLDAIDRIYGVLPDDGEQVDTAWLRSVCKHDEYAVAPACFLVFGGGQWIRVAKTSSRGQFRRLCEALGVELQERKDGE